MPAAAAGLDEENDEPKEPSSEAAAQEQAEPAGKFSGLMFGDFYFMAANHDSSLEDLNGFWMRRIYFTYDHKLGGGWDTRFRLEANSPGDFRTSSKMEPAVKDAYARWRGDGKSIYIGISGTPTWGVVEGFWGYRPVEKTPLDLQKFGSSRDFGIAVKGDIGAGKRVHYHVMLGNASSNKAEVNTGKAVYGSLKLDLSDDLFIEAYLDYTDQGGGTDRVTVQGFAGYERGDTRAGLQYAHQSINRDSSEDLSLDIASVFLVQRLSNKLALLLRADRMFDPNPSGGKISYLPFDSTARSLLLLAGIDVDLGNSVHLIPNVEYVTYEAVDSGPDPDDDLMLRATFSWSWK